MSNVACPFLFTTRLAQLKYSKRDRYAWSMCMEVVAISSKCGNSKTPYNILLWHSKQSNRNFINIFDAKLGEFGKNTKGSISKTKVLCLQTNRMKEQVVLMFVATTRRDSWKLS